MPGTDLRIPHSELTLTAVLWTSLLLPPSYSEEIGGMKWLGAGELVQFVKCLHGDMSSLLQIPRTQIKNQVQQVVYACDPKLADKGGFLEYTGQPVLQKPCKRPCLKI